MRRNGIPLDIYELFVMPKEQIAYLSTNGWHFCHDLYVYAAERMYKHNKQTGKDENVPILKKEDVDAMLARHNITIENKGGYDYVYVAQMCKNDFFGSSITDESKMALFVKDYCDDADQADGFILRRWIADMTGMGEPIDWLSFIGIKE